MTTLCYCDGGCRGNGTKDARAYGSWKIGLTSVFHEEYPDAGTNNEAEYRALLALFAELEKRGIKDAEIRMDSALVVNQLVGGWRVRARGILPLFLEVASSLLLSGAALKRVPREEIESVLGH